MLAVSGYVCPICPRTLCLAPQHSAAQSTLLSLTVLLRQDQFFSHAVPNVLNSQLQSITILFHRFKSYSTRWQWSFKNLLCNVLPPAPTATISLLISLLHHYQCLPPRLFFKYRKRWKLFRARSGLLGWVFKNIQLKISHPLSWMFCPD